MLQCSSFPGSSDIISGLRLKTTVENMLRHRAAPQPICRGSSLPSISNNTLQIQPKSHQHFILELDVRARNTSLLTVRVNRNEF